MLRHALLAIIILLASQPAFSALDIRSLTLTSADGLPGNTVRFIMQDTQGFLWFGTTNGLARYDGERFLTLHTGGKVAGLVDDRVSSLREDNDGFLWIGTAQKRMCCYDLRRGQFTDFTFGQLPSMASTHVSIPPSGDVWIWNDRAGGGPLRRVVHGEKRTLTSEVFSKVNGRLPTDAVRFVHEAEGTVWIGTQRGLVAYSRGKTAVKSCQRDFVAATAAGGQTLFATATGEIYAARGGQLRHIAALPAGQRVTDQCRLGRQWVLLTTGAAYEYDTATGTVRQSQRITMRGAKALRDEAGDCYLYNRTGHVLHINALSGHVRDLELIPPTLLSHIDHERYAIVREPSSPLAWISTYGNGLWAYDTTTGRLEHFTSGIDRDAPLNSDYIIGLGSDRSGGLWVCEERAGVQRLMVAGAGVGRFFPSDRRDFGRGNTVRMVTASTPGHLLLGCGDGELHDFDTRTGSMTTTATLPSNAYCAATDTDGQLWVGTKSGGLRVGDRWYHHDEHDKTSLLSDIVYSLLLDSKGRMWVGTLNGGLHLAVSDGKGGYRFRRFTWADTGSDNVRAIAEDTFGRLWLATSGGVRVVEINNEQLTINNCLSGSKNNAKQLLTVNSSLLIASQCFSYIAGTFCANETRCLLPASAGSMWVGTAGGGLALCTLPRGSKALTYKRYTRRDGLAHDVVHALLADRRGALWIATEYGMSRMDQRSGTFENFYFSPRTLGNAYSEATAVAAADGTLYFGTDYGLTAVSPALLPHATRHAAVTFTSLSVSGEEVEASTTLPYSKAIELAHDENTFTVSFSDFNYDTGRPTRFRYRLEGYENEWSQPTTERTVTFRRLPAGTYRLRVATADSRGVWDEQGQTLTITVSQPWWWTWWARLIYLVIIATAAYYAWRHWAAVARLRSRVRLERQLTEYKLAFFTNISHEFRTPLTLIAGALEHAETVEGVPVEARSALDTMQKATRRLLRLVNQLLTFRKMEQGHLALRLEETDVVAFLYELFLGFGDLADQKRIAFRFEPSQPSLRMAVDRDKLDKIVYNLLSNAFKYTPEGGEITLSLRIKNEQLTINNCEQGDAKVDKQLLIVNCPLLIEVTDSGVGIPEEKRGELFQRFMQTAFSRESMGIGLHLTHGLVKLHHGDIAYAPREGGGSVFTVTLPTDLERRFPTCVTGSAGSQPAKTVSAGFQPAKREETADDAQLRVGNAQAPVTQVGNLRSSSVLIVEDDGDVRQFLAEELANHYQVLTASDGLDGLEKAQKQDPDLIVCDVMMPRMDGYEVTRRLRHDFATSHIPIILLTALGSVERQTEGIDAGADAYISKPFSTKLLLTHIARLIEQRERLREKFSSEPGELRAQMFQTDRDREFAERLAQVVEANIGKADFAIDDFARSMSLSRTVFYKKIKALSGQSPVEYLRTVRVKRGAELLLADAQVTVAEVAYKVGFSDPFYFSKCFKAQMGVAPSAWQKGCKGSAEQLGKRREIKP